MNIIKYCEIAYSNEKLFILSVTKLNVLKLIALFLILI